MKIQPAELSAYLAERERFVETLAPIAALRNDAELVETVRSVRTACGTSGTRQRMGNVLRYWETAAPREAFEAYERLMAAIVAAERSMC